MLQELSKLFTQGVSGCIAGILLILYLLYAAGCTVKLWGWDLRKHRLPNRIVFPFVFATHTALPVIAALSGQWGTILRVWGSGLVLWAFYVLMRMLSFGALGRGDVKLALALGGLIGYFSWANLLWATLVTFIVGGLCAVVLVLSRSVTRRTRIAFGPLMLIGMIAAVLVPSYSFLSF